VTDANILEMNAGFSATFVGKGRNSRRIQVLRLGQMPRGMGAVQEIPGDYSSPQRGEKKEFAGGIESPIQSSDVLGHDRRPLQTGNPGQDLPDATGFC
jgi:hypothetical protein